MSFQLLKSEIIDQKLCQGCGLCASMCKSIEMVDLKPKLVGVCILEKQGESCGECYNYCPQVHQHKITEIKPEAIYSLKAENNENLIQIISSYLLESQETSQIIKTKKEDGTDAVSAYVATSLSDVKNLGEITHGPSGLLGELISVNCGIEKRTLGEKKQVTTIIGMPCEIMGADNIAKGLNLDIIKISSFCLGYSYFCGHCQDYVGIHSDISLGQTGSDKGFTTVIVWNKHGKGIIEKIIKDKNLIKGQVSMEDIDKKINIKKKRKIIEHPQSPREMILSNVNTTGSADIPHLQQLIGIPTKEVRYHALRLVQDSRMSMIFENNKPIFIPLTEEE